MEYKKIVMVGPVYPYKGGIAHYTGLMYKTLAKKYDVTMVSYRFQYPKFLFKKEQKDYADDTFKVDEAKYWLHTANPFNCMNTARRINKLRPDLVILQWLHPYFAPCFWILTKCLKHTRVLFVCHNVFPHERFPMDKLLTKWTLRQGDCYIVQSKQDEEDLKSVVKHPLYERTVHPTYNAYKFQDMTKEQARKLLQIKEEKVILFFGLIRKYKGLQYLLQAMPQIQAKVGHVKLLAAGEMRNDQTFYEKMIADCGIQDVVEFRTEYIPDQEVEKYFAAADVVVLPYVSATQSGIVQIAYGFHKPVIVTAVGGLPEVVTDGKTGYVVKPEDPEQLAEAVVRYFEEGKEEEFSRNIEEESYRFSWERMIEVVERLGNNRKKDETDSKI